MTIEPTWSPSPVGHRVPGFYWVCWSGEFWQVARWKETTDAWPNEAAWFLTGDNKPYQDLHFSRIGERIAPHEVPATNCNGFTDIQALTVALRLTETCVSGAASERAAALVKALRIGGFELAPAERRPVGVA